ncbi:MAG: hypothetical protein NT141_01485 [candidate division WWE3 bacterium]|nr:hypothetical protein [candidate division WWE3 bacterium]
MTSSDFSLPRIIFVIVFIALMGIGVGYGSGVLLKQTAPKNAIQTPLKATTTPSFSGKIFPVSIATEPAVTHELVDKDGNVTAFLQSADDKLNVVLAGTNVTVSGKLMKTTDNKPLIQVEKISF